MAQPSTPTRATGGEQASHSTPIVHKISSVFDNRIRSQLDPLITRELEDKILPTTHGLFLEYALGVTPEQAAKWAPSLDKLSNKEEVQGYIAQLREAKGEVGRYKPFCDLANFILDQTKETFPLPAIPFRFARNDPTYVRGPEHANTPKRKPDVVIAFEEVATWLELTSAQRSKGNRSRINWADILAAVEFKVDPMKPAKEIVPGKSNQSPKKVSMEAQSASSSRPRPAFQIVSELNPPSKRRSSASTPDSEPPTKKSRSGSKSGSVHTGQSGVPHDDFNQFSSYPLEMMSSTSGTRSHALGMFVDGGELQLWYYDRAGAIHSESRVDFLVDFVSFATIVMAFARLRLTMFGVLSFVDFPSKHLLPTSLEGATMTVFDENDREHIVTLTADVISYRPGIVGRSSFVCGAKCATLDDELVLKFSYQDVSRTDEYHIIQHAKGCNVDHIPIVYVSRDVECLSHGPRGDMISKTDEGELQYTDRVLRVMVSKRYTPVYKLGRPLPIFQNVMRDIFECLNQLLTKARILHRDISHTNIMAEKMPDGSFRGILNDFDLAICLTTRRDVGHYSQHRTGTLPFMAVALLTNKPVVHLFRHDLESLFYVLVWISAHYDHRDHDINHDALNSWQRGELEVIGASKLAFVLQPSMLDKLQLSGFYEPLKALWLEPLRRFFRLLVLQWSDSLNGYVTNAKTDEELCKDMSAILSAQAS